MYANIETLQLLTRADIQAVFPDTSFPPEITPDNLEGTGYAVLEFDPAPELGLGEHAEAGEVRLEGDRAIRSWTVVPPTEAELTQIIAARRYQAEISGTAIEGMPIDTGRDSQGLITGAALAAMLDADYVLHWKTSAGLVELTGQQILGVASAVRAHVQASFNRESELLNAVADGSITAEMLEEGWPA